MFQNETQHYRQSFMRSESGNESKLFPMKNSGLWLADWASLSMFIGRKQFGLMSQLHIWEKTAVRNALFRYKIEGIMHGCQKVLENITSDTITRSNIFQYFLTAMPDSHSLILNMIQQFEKKFWIIFYQEWMIEKKY